MRPIIVANWKMNTTLAEATILASSIISGLRDFSGAKVVLCPPSIWLEPIAEIIKKRLSHIELGIQNIYYRDEGPYTGEISPFMVKKICSFAIIGHSERRVHFQEDNEIINHKIHAALRNGLKPIFCVGEFKKLSTSPASGWRTKSDKSQKEILDNINKQLSQGLEGISKNEIKDVIIAYEPVWAIGTGKNAPGDHVGEVIKNIRNRLATIYNREIADDTKILYGGSADSDNAENYLKRPGVDGLLVGGACLQAKEFIKICKIV